MDREVRTGIPRAGLPRDDRTVGIVFWIGFGVSALFIAAQLVFVIGYVPVMLYAYDDAGLKIPALLALGGALGPLWTPVVLGAFDVALFAAFAQAARRYWIGLLFIPPLLYLLMAFVVFASGISGAAVMLGR